MNSSSTDIIVMQRKPWEQVTIWLDETDIQVQMVNGQRQQLLAEYYPTYSDASKRREEMILIVCSKGFSVVLGA